MKYQFLFIFISFFTVSLFAQSDIDSPYSLFGVGKDNSSYFGGSNGLSNTGIAYSNGLLLNKMNPASLTSIQPSSFLYDIGLNSTMSVKVDNSSSQTNHNFNFTHIAMGFSVKNFWKMSFGLTPKTKTSYSIDIISPVEGNAYSLYTSFSGSGGVNEVFWGHGFKITKDLSLGVELLGYFGSVNQKKYLYYSTTTIYLNEVNKYTGLGLKGGIQYKIPTLFGANTTIGAVVNLPSILSGSQDVTGVKTYASVGSATIINETDNDLDDFELPLKVGFGITSQIRKLTFNLDYKRNYWSNSYESNSNFTYKDQSVYGLGMEYKRETNSLKYSRRIVYRMGMNYDTGYLKFADSNIDSYGISAGLGLPIANSGSTLNLSYSYSREGTLNNNLVMDNYHQIALNISLVGKWFQKKKIF